MAPVPRLSVIIPLYNVERYVSRLLNTLIRESHAEFEVVIVDDASTDGSVSVVQSLIGADPRFRLITNPVNSGVSVARNHGLAMATGDYVWFVDADDDIEPGSLQKIQETLGAALEHDALTVIGERFKSTKDGLVRTGEMSTFCAEDGCRSGREMLRLLIRQNRNLQGNPWLLVVRREFLHQSGIRQAEGLSMGEDILWSMQVLLRSRKVLATSLRPYRYIVRPQSASTSLSGRTLLAIYRFVRETYLLVEKLDSWKDADIRRYFSSLAIDSLFWWNFHPDYQEGQAKGIRWGACGDFVGVEANRKMVRHLSEGISPPKRLGVWLILTASRLGTWRICDLYFRAFFRLNYRLARVKSMLSGSRRLHSS